MGRMMQLSTSYLLLTFEWPDGICFFQALETCWTQTALFSLHGL